MKLTFLGTGTSTGVPQVGCNCPVCQSVDFHDKRLRCSAIVESETTRILLDCSPDFRMQMLSIGFKRFDAVLLTHEHYDHVGGLDDLRPFSVWGEVCIYADDLCVSHLKERIPYCFALNKYPGVPQIKLTNVSPHQMFMVGDIRVTPIRVMHGSLPILGYRLNDLVYITDMKIMDRDEYCYLENMKCLVVNGLRHTPHASHQTIEEAVQFSYEFGTMPVYLTHLSHQAGFYKDSSSILPPNVQFAYDGLTVMI